MKRFILSFVCFSHVLNIASSSPRRNLRAAVNYLFLQNSALSEQEKALRKIKRKIKKHLGVIPKIEISSNPENGCQKTTPPAPSTPNTRNVADFSLLNRPVDPRGECNTTPPQRPIKRCSSSATTKECACPTRPPKIRGGRVKQQMQASKDSLLEALQKKIKEVRELEDSIKKIKLDHVDS